MASLPVRRRKIYLSGLQPRYTKPSDPTRCSTPMDKPRHKNVQPCLIVSVGPDRLKHHQHRPPSVIAPPQCNTMIGTHDHDRRQPSARADHNDFPYRRRRWDARAGHQANITQHASYKGTDLCPATINYCLEINARPCNRAFHLRLNLRLLGINHL